MLGSLCVCVCACRGVCRALSAVSTDRAPLSRLHLAPPRFGLGYSGRLLGGNKDTALRFPAGPTYGSCSLIQRRWIHPKLISSHRLIWQTRPGRWRAFAGICLGVCVCVCVCYEIDVDTLLLLCPTSSPLKIHVMEKGMRCQPVVIYPHRRRYKCEAGGGKLMYGFAVNQRCLRHYHSKFII